ncbi:MAG: U32 family peptidase [Verrucomicrobiales bacterium]|nr:U32 family peptidase [Verrucomicrobiales bacterium]
MGSSDAVPTLPDTVPSTSDGGLGADSARDRPELLAPAGDWECARAAVENGADAIYFGLSRFNARLRANNFSEADLPELMAWLHRRGVRGYVTFNTLVFQDELEEAEEYLRTIIRAGVDAAIVQDIGICRLIRRLSPDFPIHASTQTTVTSPAGVAFVRELGCQRVVLARENSVPEIQRIQEELRVQGTSLPLEVFVHGALCVAYSGQCLTSEALGGRSANRGECAQACRLPYELLSDGQAVPLGDRRYLLSPQDLSGLELLPDLLRAGVRSLKIEGRLKSPEYVASITRVYRAAIDRIADGPNPPATNPDRSGGSQARYELEMAFSRGLYSGWLGGIDNQSLVHGRFGKKRGVYLGRLTRVGHDRVWLRPENPLKAGDGVVFDAGRPDAPEEGGRIFTVIPGSRGMEAVEVALTFRTGAVDFRRLKVGDLVWKTSDPELERHLRQSFEGEAIRHTRPVHAEVHGRSGGPLTLVLRDDDGNLVRVDSNLALCPAERHPLGEERLREQLGRLGGTPFHLGRLQIRLEGGLMLPVAELNRLRRDAVQQMEQRRAEPRRWRLSAGPIARDTHATETAKVESSRNETHAVTQPVEPDLVVLVRTLPQLEAALGAEVRTIYCELEDPKRFRDAVRIVRTRSGTRIYLAPPRITKPGEDWILQWVRTAQPDGILARNYDHLREFRDLERVGDFSLNIANRWTAEYFLERHGLHRVTASYDLNADQLEALLRASPPHWFEVTLHQHMPMFHMEHCLFCAFLSKGKDYHDCGRPCDRHQVHLKDRVGATHPIKADAGCRNTVFNARAQTGAEHAGRLIGAGARVFRLEMLNETPSEVGRLIDRYRRLLRGEIQGEALWREFRLVNQLGVTRGQMGRATGADLGVDRWTDTKAYAASW